MTPVQPVRVTADQGRAIQLLVADITGGTGQIALEQFVDHAAILAGSLPESIREQFYKFKLHDNAPGLLVSGSPISTATYAATPMAIQRKEHEVIFGGEIIQLLFCALLGEPFTWNSIQEGNLINEIVPVPEHAETKQSSGSKLNFGLHTEDAFHPCAGDYISLFCLRNPTGTPTTISYIGDCHISESDKTILFEKKFVVGVNVAHKVDPAKIERQAILFGNRKSPFIRINLNYPPELGSDPDVAAAYSRLAVELEKNVQQVALRDGDILFLDNFRTAHGRPPYEPTYGGADRWLKRVYVTADLRKSCSLRTEMASRVIELL